MKQFIKKLTKSAKGSVDVVSIVVDVVLVCALIPVIATFIADANLSATEQTILGLTTLFIVLGLAFSVVKQMGLIKK